jgi:hypothetical protein
LTSELFRLSKKDITACYDELSEQVTSDTCYSRAQVRQSHRFNETE